jgi:hypothetical protein
MTRYNQVTLSSRLKTMIRWHHRDGPDNASAQAKFVVKGRKIIGQSRPYEPQLT